MRVNNIPEDDSWETHFEVQLAAAGRKRGVPPEGLIGAHLSRARHSSTDGSEAESEPPGLGSAFAPTAEGTARERERHRLEHDLGHTRVALDEAAREADRRV